MKSIRLIAFAFRRGRSKGYNESKRFYAAELKRIIKMKDDEIETLRKMHDEEIKKLAVAKEEETQKLKKNIRDVQRAYGIFVDDLMEFSAVLMGQASETNIITTKAAELMQAVHSICERAETVTRRIEKRDEKIRKLLHYEIQ